VGIDKTRHQDTAFKFLFREVRELAANLLFLAYGRDLGPPDGNCALIKRRRGDWKNAGGGKDHFLSF
jgi:hypothetical protein